MTTTLPLPIDPITIAPESPASPRRNGKIARLPKATRDMINSMLDDGLPYHVILDELGQAGEGINLQNLTNWKQGGYQDWIKNQELAERTRAQTEMAIDLLRENPDVDPAMVTKASSLVGAAQLFQAIQDYGDAALKKMLQEKPEKYISILNLVCRMSESGLRSAKYHDFLKQLKQIIANSNQGESR
jgi:hypothetical protein